MQFLGLQGASTTTRVVDTAGSRTSSAFGGMCVGFVMFFASLGLVWWGEGRSVYRAKSINLAAESVNEVSCIPDANREGRLVHFSCDISGYKTFNENVFAAPIKALTMSYSSEMYQWYEKKTCTKQKCSVGSTSTCETCTYYYEKKWSSTYIDPANWQGNNDQGETARQVCRRRNNFVACLNPRRETLLASKEEKTTSMMIGGFGPYSESKYVDIGTRGEVAVKSAGDWTKGVQDYLYNKYNTTGQQNSDNVGDIRRKYFYTNATTASVIAAQKGSSTAPWDSGVEGYPIEEIAVGKVNAKDMLTAAQEANEAMTWILRFVFFLMCWTGLQLITGPVAVLPSLIPFVGGCIGDLIGAMLCYVNFFVAATLCLIIGAIAWVRFRPHIGIPLLAAGCVMGAIALYFRCKRKPRPV